MRFSIIVPVYNVESYLAECLDSIVNQTYQDYEIICINDASTDSSYEKMLFYAERYPQIKTVNNECNRGLSFCRNVGMDLAKGEYILFVDSDDMLYPDALSILDRAVAQNSVEMVCFGFTLQNESRGAKERGSEGLKADWHQGIQTGQKWFMEMSQKDAFCWCACTRLCKRDFLTEQKLKFYEGIVHEDVLHTFQCALKASTVICIKENIYIYRKREGSITSSMSERRLDSLIIVLGEILAYWITSDLEPEVDRAIERCIYSYFFPLIHKMMALFPEHKQMGIGTIADQFLLDLVKNSSKQRFHYVHLSVEELKQIKEYDHVIVYGAGTVATELLTYLMNYQIGIKAVAVSDKSINPPKILNINVYQIEELINLKESVLVMIGVVNRCRLPILEKLESLGFKNIMCIDTDWASSDA